MLPWQRPGKLNLQAVSIEIRDIECIPTVILPIVRITPGTWINQKLDGFKSQVMLDFFKSKFYPLFLCLRNSPTHL